LFLFLPVASGMTYLAGKFRNNNILMYRMLQTFALMLVVVLGISCYTRNMVWATEKTLWQDAMQKAPTLARPYQNVASALEREQNLDTALYLYQKALDLKDPEPKLSRFISYGNMGNIYRKRKEYDKAVKFLTAAIHVETGPYIDRVRYNLVLCLLNTQRQTEALKHLAFLLARQKTNQRFLTTKGFILSQEGNIDSALACYRSAFQQEPHSTDLLLNMAAALNTGGSHERAETLLKKALDKAPHNIVIHLALLQHALTIQDKNRIDHRLSQIVKRFKLGDIQQYLTERAKGWHYVNHTLVPVDDAMVIPALVEHLKQKAKNLNQG
jgi:tetratricopeptide (TPR) repeat protein